MILPFVNPQLFPITTFCSTHIKMHSEVDSFMGLKCSWPACSSLGSLLGHFCNKCDIYLPPFIRGVPVISMPFQIWQWLFKDLDQFCHHLWMIPWTCAGQVIPDFIFTHCCFTAAQQPFYCTKFSLDFNGTHATIHPFTLLCFMHLLVA